MIEFMVIKDTVNGKTIQISRNELGLPYVVYETDGEAMSELKVVRTRSIGKVIRTWMKESKKDA